jgi:hypothetical protein
MSIIGTEPAVPNSVVSDRPIALGDRVIGAGRIMLTLSVGVPVLLCVLFAFTPVLPEWVSFVYLLCALLFFFVAIVTIPVGKSASLPRRLFPLLILFTWTISWVVIWAMMNYKLSSSTSACFNHPLTRIDAIYVAVTTLTTLGSARFSPLSQSCTMGIGVQSGLDWVITIAFITTFVSRYFSAKAKSE